MSMLFRVRQTITLCRPRPTRRRQMSPPIHGKEGVMVTTATAKGETATRTESTLDIASTRRGGRGPRGGNGKGPNGGGPGGGGGDERGREFSPERYRIGMWVGLASILMMFTALASALIVRTGLPGSTDWHGGTPAA